MSEFFVRPIEDKLEAYDALLCRQIAERYGVPVENVTLRRPCGGGIQVMIAASDPISAVTWCEICRPAEQAGEAGTQ